MTEKAKQLAAEKALDFIVDGMTVGLGTGTTAHHFIKRLLAKKLKIQVVATSLASEKLAVIGGLTPIQSNQIDVVVDGADAVDPQLNLIKGAGGALLREKIVAAAAKEMIVIVDETKLLPLTNVSLPVEIIPFCHGATLKQIQDIGFTPHLRDFTTDNGNLIVDLTWGTLTPSLADPALKAIPGVLETGLFLGMATKVLVGKVDGTVEILERAKK